MIIEKMTKTQFIKDVLNVDLALITSQFCKLDHYQKVVEWLKSLNNNEYQQLNYINKGKVIKATNYEVIRNVDNEKSYLSMNKQTCYCLKDKNKSTVGYVIVSPFELDGRGGFMMYRIENEVQK